MRVNFESIKLICTLSLLEDAVLFVCFVLEVMPACMHQFESLRSKGHLFACTQECSSIDKPLFSYSSTFLLSIYFRFFRDWEICNWWQLGWWIYLGFFLRFIFIILRLKLFLGFQQTFKTSFNIWTDSPASFQFFIFSFKF